jgi:CelD/BcsL family acetyltransferase involved in cellulose biosynthesis
MHVVRHDHLEDVPAEVWDSLAAAPQAGIFQSYGWHRAVVKAYGEGAGLCILGIYDSGACAGIAPLQFECKGTVRVLRFIGDVRADYCDVLYAAECAGVIAALIRWLADNRSLWDELELNNIPFHAASRVHIERQVKLRGWSLLRQPLMPCPALVIRGDASAAEKVLNKKSLKRHGRYFTGQPGFEVRHHLDLKAAARGLNGFFAQHIQRWTGRDAQSLFIDPGNRDFYRALLNEPSLEGRVMFTEIIADGALIAGHFGFIDKGKLLWYKPSFDILLARHYPGEVLLRELIVYVRDHGLGELDFTRGDESFKSRFANVVRQNYACVITPDAGRCRRLKIRAVLGKMPFVRRCYGFAMDLKELLYVLLHRRRVVRELRQSVSAADGHQGHYTTDRAVRQYLKDSGLQKPEAAILEMLRPLMKSMRVLDIGMGAGRTSVYFATAAREYTAFDFSPSMVQASRRCAGDLVDPARFMQGDARRMDFLEARSFDLVLMSFNAIDCVSPSDRLLVFEQVRRVAAEGGWFCFSSHNLQSLSLRGRGGIGSFFRRAARYLLLMEANPGIRKISRRDNAMVLDASGHYQLPLYYIRPRAQVQQLTAAGFRDIRVFSVLTGKEVCGEAHWARLREGWVYYLCRV